MRRIFALLTICILMAGVLVLPARADSAASKIDIRATVTAEGDCLISMNAMIRMESAQPDLKFPLPGNAKGITMNGANVSSTKVGTATLVDISRITGNSIGEYSLMFEFTIPEAVKVAKINVDENFELASQFRVASILFWIYSLKDGEMETVKDVLEGEA